MRPENDEITQIKRQIGVYDLALSAGVKLRKINANEYEGLCPFHADQNPSLHINPAKNLFHCKGCGKEGSPIDWVVHESRVSVGEAIKLLKAKLPALFPLAENKPHMNGGHRMQTNDLPEDLSQLRLEPENQKILRMYAEACHKSLKSEQLPIDYLMKRGIVHGEIIDEHLVGFAPGDLLEKVKSDKEQVQHFLKVGILRYDNDKASETYGKILERFAGCIVFPIISTDGIITGIYGRRIAGHGEKHNYLPGGHLGFFNPRALIAKEIIITESIIDALSVMSLGYRNVISAYGAQGFTDEIREALLSAGTERLYVAFDADNGGNRGADKIVEKLKGSAGQIYRVHFPDGFDPNEFIRKTENAAETFKNLIINSSILSLADSSPETAEAKPDFQKHGSEYHFTYGERNYIAKGLDKNADDTTLKCVLRAAKESKFHVDSLDLYNAKACWGFVKSATEKLAFTETVIRADLDKVTLCLETELKAYLAAKAKPQLHTVEFKKNLEMEFKSQKFFAEPDFFVRFLEIAERCALVGENLNIFYGLISTLSRFTYEQLNLLIQSESASGKSALLNLLADFVPDEDKLYFTQITAKSFYHGEEGFLYRKCIFLAEMLGFLDALYPIQQMMSEKKLSHLYTVTDPKTGKFAQEIKSIFGPDQFTITLPQEDVPEDFANRCVILAMNDSLEQSRRVMEFMRRLKSPAGTALRKARAEHCEIVQYWQRSLKVHKVINPYAEFILYPLSNSSARRDYQKLLSFTECLTIAFQHFREKVTVAGETYVKTHPIEIILSGFVSRRTFGKVSLTRLPVQTENFVLRLAKFYKKFSKEKQIEFTQVKFYRHDMQDITKLSMNRVHEHAKRTERAEVFITERDKNGISYRFRFEPDEEGKFTKAAGFVDVDALLRKCSKKEREEYQAFLPTLEKLFTLLDPSWQPGNPI